MSQRAWNSLDQSRGFVSGIRLGAYLICLATTLCGAQITPNTDTARGSSPYASYEGGDIDSVNPISGNVFLHIPLLSFPQRGHALRLNFNIYYNAKQWFIYGYSGYPSGAPHPTQYQGTWSYWNGTTAISTPPSTVGVYVARDQHVELGEDHIQTVVATDETTVTTDRYGYWVREPDGAQHYYADTATQTCALSSPTNSGTCGFSVANYGTLYLASDGSGFLNNTAGLNQTSILDRDGNTYTIPSANSNYEVITDPSGNSISASASGWTDTTGRSIPGSYSGPGTSDGVDSSSNASSGAFDPIPGVASALPSQCSGANVARTWIVPELAATSKPYYFCYSNVPFHTAFNIDTLTNSTTYAYVNEAIGMAPNLLTAIILPNGTAYRFTYDLHLCLASITLPTGGSITYTWQNIAVAGGPGGFGTLPVTRVLKTRTLNPGNGEASSTWTYHRYYINANSSDWTIVTDPLGNDVEHHVQAGGDFNGNPLPGPEDARTVYSGCSPNDTASDKTCVGTGTVLQTDGYTLQTYGGDTNGGGPWAPLNLTRQTATTTTLGSVTRKVTTSFVPNYGSCQSYSFNGTSTPIDTARTSCYTAGQVANVAAYDYGSSGSGSPGSLLNTKTTSYLWQSSSAYLSSNMFDLVSSVLVTDSSGKKASETDYGYDENNGSPQGEIGNKTSTTSWLSGGTSPVTQVVYNTQGEPTKITDPKSNATQMSYQCSGSLPNQVTNALNQITTYVYDCGTGILDSVSDANSQTTTYTHNDTLNRLTNIAYPDGGSFGINFNGDPTPPKVTTTTATGETSGNLASTILYDGVGRETETQLTSDPAGTVYTDTTYDTLGRVQSVSSPYRNTSDPTYGLTSYLYDALGRKTYQCQPDNSTTQTTTCTPQNSYQSWAYSGRAVTFQDENGNQWQQTTDGLGRLSTVLEPTAIATKPTMETDYTYDALNNLVQVDQYGGPKNEANASSIDRVRQFNYDSLSRLTSATNAPELGTATIGSGKMSYTYDGNGNVSKKTDARSVAISYVYDALNRLTKKSYSDGTISALFGYDGNDASGKPLKNSSNAVGRLSQLSEDNPDGSAVDINDISYDVMGRIANKNECIPGDCSYGINVTATYDLAGNVSTLTNGSKAQPVTFTYTYDGAGRLGTITSSLKTSAYPATLFKATSTSPVAYAAAGMLQHATLGVPTSGAATLTLDQSYDNRQRLIYESAVNSTSKSLYSACMPDGSANTHCTGNAGYQPNGNLANVTDSVVGRWNYTYDDLNRLSTAAAYSGPYNGQYGCWSYDPFGNRTLEAVSTTKCTGSPTPTYWAKYANLSTLQNQVTSTALAPSGYTYDKAGNVQNDGVNNYLYDGEGRVCAVQSSTVSSNMEQYIYDPAGSRVGKGTITSFSCDKTKNGFTDTVGYVLGINGEQLTEINGSNVWQHTNAFANGKLLATYSGTNTYFAITDWLGTKRVIAGVDGCVSNYVSLPFGDSLQSSAATGFSPCSDPSEHHYTGKERDTESGLDYFGARYFGSSMGRFMSPDFNGTDDYASPVPYADLSNPQTLNLYAYAGNNPLSNVDPDGHNVQVCGDNGNGGQNCINLTDDQYKNLYNQQNGQQGINLPGGSMPGGNVTCGGQVCGSANFYEPGLQDESGSLLMGLAGGMATEFAIGKVAGAVSSMLGRGAAEAAGAGAGKAAGAAVDVTNLSAKIVKQMGTRGWTAQEITQTVENGTAHAVTNKATGGAATEFINPANGKFVVVDNATRQVIQVSGPGFSPNHLVQ